jgi:RNA polymerase sigma-70 factor, ECF subfamily
MDELTNNEAIPSSDIDASNLEALMVRYQAADPAATERLLGALFPLLIRFFASMRDTRDVADDLAQDTLLRIHRARQTHRPGEPLLPWVYAIARHTRIDHFRRNRRRKSQEEQVDAVDLQKFAAPPQESSQQPEFDALLSNLPESQREVLTMLKVLGMTVEEVARATSSTAGAVKQKAHRAYEKLRAVLENPSAGQTSSKAGA